MIEEKPFVAQTIYDGEGQVIGGFMSNGQFLEQAPVPLTQWSWDEELNQLVELDVVWCGAKLRNDWSRTRGELLGDYSRMNESKEMREAGGPARVKVATWSRMMDRKGEE